MVHVILLGDSILDNGAYVSEGSPVVEQLRLRLPREWRVTLLARDGATASDVIKQLQQLPDDATHLIVSAGGNDALNSIPVLTHPAQDTTSLLSELVATHSEFQDSYQQLIRKLLETRLRIIGCTIYDAVPAMKPEDPMMLSLFNDVIVRELIRLGVPILDLRCICNEPRDYSSVSPIEPSEIGGAKIAQALQEILLFHDFSRSGTIVYP